jgi:Flp pilus assembly protein TadG
MSGEIGKALRRLPACTRAAAAVEAAIVFPFFLILALGVTDLGTVMFERMAVNAAAQAGAAYAVFNANGNSGTCWANGVPALTSNCLTGIETAMNNGSGGLTINASPAPTIASCADASPTCVVVSAAYTYLPILPYSAYSWATSLNLSSTVTIRIQ